MDLTASKQPTFIQAEDKCWRGLLALAKLSEVNDLGFAEPSGEVLAVDSARWHHAQQYERDAWLKFNKWVDDAHNMQWAERFNQYQALPEDLGDFIELGAGPFTNARIILKSHRCASLTLLDPLALDYLQHPNCVYQSGTLGGHPVILVPQAIEDWVPAQQYDTVVMINTLHHCRDARLVLRRISEVLKPGGWLVWGEWPVEVDPALHYNEGHPITPHAATLEEFLSSFEEVWRDGWNFIGRKPNA